MIPASLISKKRDGDHLSKIELRDFIQNYLSGLVSEEQMAAMLMAIFFNGMDENEIIALVEIMVDSGSSLDFSNSERYVADKHSTGGIGDKISLILAPIMASAGVKVPMIAGRGLGFTGGTIDKLESIPGFNTSPTLDQFKNWVNKSGYAIMSQSIDICPADKKIYDLRSRTGIVPAVPLICGSIMSKKIAEGISGLVLDIKVGSGTFMKTIDQAKELGSWMKKIGNLFNIRTDIVYTNMNQPIGQYAGLACEVQESIECLTGKGPNDLISITLELGSSLLIQAGLAEDKDQAVNIQKDMIESGKALQSFEVSVRAQGGKLDKLISSNKPKYEILILSGIEGIIHTFDTETIGWALVELGCVQKNKNQELDHSAGIEFLKKIGDTVVKEEPVYRLFSSNKVALDNASNMLKKTLGCGNGHKEYKLIL